MIFVRELVIVIFDIVGELDLFLGGSVFLGCYCVIKFGFEFELEELLYWVISRG